ncbi:glucan 1,4-alpha-glucosidase [Sulfobacillus thermotolerans]|uniref:Glucan 1,4-alpha-glucosidase n=1 Tax=Sulfobacillus thermotolerans TaxID=338644 RepID=A0ABM6RRE9_9FIRM|nr:glucan 1,4-alpha-glucosidase [Sulfobacillus thermotolerans]
MSAAPGHPGLDATWTSSAKHGVGTAMADTSRVWFTLSHGILNEIYFPRMDVANTRDAQLLIVSRDGQFWEEKRDLIHEVQYIHPDAPAYKLINTDPQGRFRITKRIVTWPEGDALLTHVRFEVLQGARSDYRVFFLLAPHIKNQGGHNNAALIDLRGRQAVMAWRGDAALCIGSTVPFVRRSVGFVGYSDGWTQLHGTRELIEYTEALDGNVALTAELDLTSDEQTLAVAFGGTREEAQFTAELALLHNYYHIEQDYIAGWSAYMDSLPGLVPHDHPHAHLQRVSAFVLKTHHGKLFPGGIIASLSIPWGNAAGDGNMGGYHLVWPRDMVEAAQAFLALGDITSARQSLFFLMATQQANGSWPQNFWLDGQPYWKGSQLDETAFPILLAYRLEQMDAMRTGEDLYPMVRRALAYICQTGPVTEQDRWEEDSGYSPSTLAITISALIVGAELARRRGDNDVAAYCEMLADYWQGRIDKWTFTEHGQVDPRFPCHYIRIHTQAPRSPDGRVDHGFVPIKNMPPGAPNLYPEEAVIDGGFLELVRYGLKAADDPHITQSVAAYDAILKQELPYGPLWHRYNHDGYGEQEDGSPFQGHGRGRLWPLLAGERGHYAIALGQSPEPYLAAMEGSASIGGLLPEQVWDSADIPERELFLGRPSGSAMPLVWAHAEYIKLVRSAMDGHVFELPELVHTRYIQRPHDARHSGMLFWQFNHKRLHWHAGDQLLRIAVPRPGVLVYTTDEWAHVLNAELHDAHVGMYYHDIALHGLTAVEFTFYWSTEQRWEGMNYRMERSEGVAPARSGCQ